MERDKKEENRHECKEIKRWRDKEIETERGRERDKEYRKGGKYLQT